MKFFIILVVLPWYYVETCNEFARPISALLRGWATQLLSWKCCSDGEPLSTLTDLTGPRFEPQISRFRDEQITLDLKLLNLAAENLIFLHSLIEKALILRPNTNFSDCPAVVFTYPQSTF